ncbi:hypothetical protein [Rhizobium sp. S163]|uniref:hypothetical protein n=1 Tax=Rhizobium sp. S163 TaxID=3055039 RepID=UPI0025A98486|nr:hypothetical protein [Rhizobium sp. S163]MDM9645404.1 hypothetical protein [Rhizobium sp. S163]
MEDRELLEADFRARLRTYVTASKEQDEWDAIAPVGMNDRQRKKEQKLHSATEDAYESLWDFVRASAEGRRLVP